MRRSIARTRSRGTITSRTVRVREAEDVAEDAARVGPDRAGRRAPPRRAARAPPASARRAPRRAASRRARARARCRRRSSTRRIGRNTRPKTSSGCAQASATGPGRSSASAFGASSPTTTCRNVIDRERDARSRPSARPRSTRCPTAASGGAISRASAGSPTKPSPMLASVMPSCVAAIASSRLPIARADRARAAAPGLHPQLHLGAAHRDERELGRDEVGVEQDQRGDREQAEQRERRGPRSSVARPPRSRQRLAPGEVVDELLRGASGAARALAAPSAAPRRGSAPAAPRGPRASRSDRRSRRYVAWSKA